MTYRFATTNPPFQKDGVDRPSFYNNRMRVKNNWTEIDTIKNIKTLFVNKYFTTEPIVGVFYKMDDWFNIVINISFETDTLPEIKSRYFEVKLDNEAYPRYYFLTDQKIVNGNTLQITGSLDIKTTYDGLYNFTFEQENSLFATVERRMPSRYALSTDKTKFQLDFRGISAVIPTSQGPSDNLYQDSVPPIGKIFENNYPHDFRVKMDSAPFYGPNSWVDFFGFMKLRKLTAGQPFEVTRAYYYYALVKVSKDSKVVESASVSKAIDPYQDGGGAWALPYGCVLVPLNCNDYRTQGGVPPEGFPPEVDNSYNRIASLPNSDILGVFVSPICPNLNTDPLVVIELDGTSATQLAGWARLAFATSTTYEPYVPEFLMRNEFNPADEGALNPLPEFLLAGLDSASIHMNDSYTPQYDALYWSTELREFRFSGITGDSAPFDLALLSDEDNNNLNGSFINWRFNFNFNFTQGLVTWVYKSESKLLRNAPSMIWKGMLDAHIPNGADAWTNFMNSNKSQFNTSLLQKGIGMVSGLMGAGQGMANTSEKAGGALGKASLIGAGVQVAGMGLDMLSTMLGRHAQKADAMRQSYDLQGTLSNSTLNAFDYLLSGNIQDPDYIGTGSWLNTIPESSFVGTFTLYAAPQQVQDIALLRSRLFGNPINELKFEISWQNLQTRDLWDYWQIHDIQNLLLRGQVPDLVIDELNTIYKNGVRLWHWQEEGGFDNVYDFNRMNWEIYLNAAE